LSIQAHNPRSHFKAFKFTGSLIVATFLFIIGYIYREIGAYNYKDINVYIVSLCMIYGSPPVYELANYVIMGRVLYYIPYHSPLHPGRVITTFGFLSTLVETFAGNGASLLANPRNSQRKQNIGHNLLRAGLVIQLAVLIFFFCLAIHFQRECTRHGLMPKRLRSVLTTLYISNTLMLTRTVYRTVEYFSASQIHVTPNFNPMSLPPVIRYEWFFWVFEATLMIANSLLLNFRHPAMYLPWNTKIYLAEDGQTEFEGPGYEDKRNFIMTNLDPCDAWGLWIGRDKDRYWENHERVLPNQPVEAGALASEDGIKEKVKVVPKVEKMTAWSLFKRAFLTDRGNQGHEVRSGAQQKDTQTPESTHLEKNAVQPQLENQMVVPTMASSSTS
jgi:hypothetical protein